MGHMVVTTSLAVMILQEGAHVRRWSILVAPLPPWGLPRAHAQERVFDADTSHAALAHATLLERIVRAVLADAALKAPRTAVLRCRKVLRRCHFARYHQSETNENIPHGLISVCPRDRFCR